MTLTLPAAFPRTVDAYTVTADLIAEVRVTVTEWADNSYSVHAEYDATAVPHTEVFDPLIEDIDHLPTRAEIIEAFEEAHLARCESIAEGRLYP